MTNSSAPLLHFSLGPVQGFVGQSRRTRDLWASSFLLSYLAGRALQATTADEFVLPTVKDNPLWDALNGGEPARHGTIPNRFVVRVDDPAAAAKKARGAIDEAWGLIADAVWSQFVESVASDETRYIWERQIHNFWETSWAVGDEFDVLDRRKNWRSNMPTIEPGDHCTMMPRLQELSGVIVAGRGNHERKLRAEQDQFWESLRSSMKSDLDLADGERLCAVALVKRLFPRIATEAIGWDVSATSWPSTAYLAAAPWVSVAATHLPEAAQRYAAMVKQAQPSALGERGTFLASMSALNGAGEFPDLDGNFFLDDALQNERATRLSDASARNAITKALRNTLYDKCGKPGRHYAVVLMDGDRMGKLLQSAVMQNRTSVVSGALGRFAAGVARTVQERDGVTVYSGGDDVLVFCTVPAALEIAAELRREYLEEFAEINTAATISCGIVYAHYKTPLRDVLREAHHQLDDVAKDRNGRDSIALALLKASGKVCETVHRWNEIIGGTHDEISPLQQLSNKLGGERREVSSSFVYGMRDLLIRLSPETAWRPGVQFRFDTDVDVEALFRAQYARSREDSPSPEEVRMKTKELIALARRSDEATGASAVGIDVMLLARFLADSSEVSR